MKGFLRFITGIGFLFLTLNTQAIVRYVRPTVAGLGDGSSWTNASADLQLMINNSAAGDTIWVAEGTYLPLPPLLRCGYSEIAPTPA